MQRQVVGTPGIDDHHENVGTLWCGRRRGGRGRRNRRGRVFGGAGAPADGDSGEDGVACDVSCAGVIPIMRCIHSPGWGMVRAHGACLVGAGRSCRTRRQNGGADGVLVGVCTCGGGEANVGIEWGEAGEALIDENLVVQINLDIRAAVPGGYATRCLPPRGADPGGGGVEVAVERSERWSFEEGSMNRL